MKLKSDWLIPGDASAEGISPGKASQLYEWCQIVRWPKAFNLSYNRHLRVEELTSGGQFSAKNRENYALKWRKFFQIFF